MTEIIDPDDDRTGATPLELEDRRGVARLEAFSDGVFAIAITLLVLGVEIPNARTPNLNDAINALVPNIVAYFIGFAVIGLFWVSHHAFFAEVERHDLRLLWSNLLFLSLVAAMPFTTGLIGEFSGQRDAVILFAANVSLASLAGLWSETAAVHSRLLRPNSHLYDWPFPPWASLITPAVFLISIPIAFIEPTVAQYFWLTSLLASRFIDD